MFSLFILLLIISFLCFFNQHCPLQKPFIFSIFSSAKVEIELDNVEGLQKTIEIDGENDTNPLALVRPVTTKLGTLTVGVALDL